MKEIESLFRILCPTSNEAFVAKYNYCPVQGPMSGGQWEWIEG